MIILIFLISSRVKMFINVYKFMYEKKNLCKNLCINVKEFYKFIYMKEFMVTFYESINTCL